jgi:rhamnulose-1-phosphate aldolase/alcohol dehydrogenase
MVDYLNHCLTSPKDKRPSIEALLHALLPYKDIDHTHADAILAITDVTDPQKVVKEVYKDEALFVPYVMPGFTLAKVVKELFEKSATPKKYMILAKHGPVCWGNSSKECYHNTVDMVSLAEEYLEHKKRGKIVFGGFKYSPTDSSLQRSIILQVMPILRGKLSQDKCLALHWDHSELVMKFVNSSDSPRISQAGTATPDQILRTQRLPLLINASLVELIKRLRLEELKNFIGSEVDEYVRNYERYFQRNKTDPNQAMQSPYPKVILMPQLGLITAEKDKKSAIMVADIYKSIISVIEGAEAVDRFTPISEAEAFAIDYWPLELYKRTLEPPEKELARKIALITGGGSGIGEGIAKKFAENGAYVVVADINFESAKRVADDIEQKAGKGKAYALKVDVTKDEEVAAAFEEIILNYGGLDILVCNAGTFELAAIDELTPEHIDKHFALNVKGYMLVTKHATRLMKRQGLGGNIIFNASKAAFATGSDASTYGATKAAVASFARNVAKDLGVYGIRANYVNADNVRTPLFDKLLKERAAGYGISVEEMNKRYAERNFLRIPNVPIDLVAEAFLYLASDRSKYTTGGVITVDGGLDNALPR